MRELGQIIPRHDPVLGWPARPKILMGRPAERSGREGHRAQVHGLNGELAGVAMIPVFDGETLLAMLELARTDHPFRAGDTETLLSRSPSSSAVNSCHVTT